MAHSQRAGDYALAKELRRIGNATRIVNAAKARQKPVAKKATISMRQAMAAVVAYLRGLHG